MIRRTTMILAALMAVLTAMARTWAVDELPNVQQQDHTKHLVNPDGIVSAATQAQIDTLLLDARRQSSAEIVAVIVDDIDSYDIDSYATELFNSWGIGKKDKNNGILIVVARDSHQATIRTGYGAEGIMPDILAGRIVNDVMIPHFRDGDYDGGLLAGVKEVHRLVTDPQARQELESQMADNYQYGAIDGGKVMDLYLTTAAVVTILLLAWVGIMLVKSRKRKMTDYQKYQYLHQWQTTFWIAALLFVGIPAVAAVALWLLTRYYRNHPRRCPRCRAQMQKLSETEDNKYLNYAQDLEERIKSVDYDVWLCPKCGEKDIYSFVNKASSYTECPKCRARTMKLSGTRVLKEPTYRSKGQGEKLYTCLNCQHQERKHYTIAKKEPPVVVVGGGGSRGGFGGGGFGGGSFGGGFGGGLTGGGGATGRW